MVKWISNNEKNFRSTGIMVYLSGKKPGYKAFDNSGLCGYLLKTCIKKIFET